MSCCPSELAGAGRDLLCLSSKGSRATEVALLDLG